MKNIIATFLLTSILWISLWISIFLISGLLNSPPVPNTPESITDGNLQKAPHPANIPITEPKPSYHSTETTPAEPKQSAEITAIAQSKPSTSVIEQSPTQTKQAPETGETTNRPAPVESNSIDYTSEIIGSWKPVEGAKDPLEFTKYGIVIQWKYGTVDIRKKYTISNNKVTFEGRGKATIDISYDATGIYLEISNNKEYSGKYQLTRRPRPIWASSALSPNDYATAIVGKWDR